MTAECITTSPPTQAKITSPDSLSITRCHMRAVASGTSAMGGSLMRHWRSTKPWCFGTTCSKSERMPSQKEEVRGNCSGFLFSRTFACSDKANHREITDLPPTCSLRSKSTERPTRTRNLTELEHVRGQMAVGSAPRCKANSKSARMSLMDAFDSGVQSYDGQPSASISIPFVPIACSGVPRLGWVSFQSMSGSPFTKTSRLAQLKAENNHSCG
mmetsp:Transcript_61420/g.163424  ORF Transcript_61420/g.163424 Transcript_61420/m.163424 type:complete len:214 (+) Transcript_61420:594-1235(+)